MYRTILRLDQGVFSIGSKINALTAGGRTDTVGTMKKEAVAKAIKKRVAASGRTRVDIARDAGLSESQIRQYEDGTQPALATAHALLDALGYRLTIGDPDGPELLGPYWKP